MFGLYLHLRAVQVFGILVLDFLHARGIGLQQRERQVNESHEEWVCGCRDHDGVPARDPAQNMLAQELARLR